MKSLMICEDQLGSDHERTVYVYVLICQVHFYRKDYNQALSYYNKARVIYETVANIITLTLFFDFQIVVL